MTSYRLTIQTTSQHLATILQVIEGTAMIEKIDVMPHTELPKPSRNFRFANGIRNKGISAEQCVLNILGASGGPKTVKEVGELMAYHGKFAPTTSSPTLFNLRKQGTVMRLVDGRYALTDSAAGRANGVAR
jgi:hypothetical protein